MVGKQFWQLSVKMFVTLFIYFFPHHVSTSSCMPLCLPPDLLPDSAPSCSHTELSGTPAPLNDVNASLEPVKGLSELRIPSRSHIEGSNHRFPFRPPVPLHGHPCILQEYSSPTPPHPTFSPPLKRQYTVLVLTTSKLH